MHESTRISRWASYVVEACWLLALTLIPIAFNLYSARHFEPDKIAALRALALIAATAALIGALDRLVARGQPQPADAAPGPGPWARLRAVPLAIPALAYALVLLLTTALSVAPQVSLWGSYQRGQGAYTNLCYIVLGGLLLFNLRRPAQVERLITVALAGGVTVAGYGIIQHLRLDPLPWGGDVILRVASTMGNSIFVAAYMIMLVPLALYRLGAGLATARTAPPAPSPRAEWLWALARLALLLGPALLLLSLVKFGAAVQTSDFRYWWVLPAGVICATAIWWLLTIDLERRPDLPWWPGALTVGFLLLLGAQFALSVNEQRMISPARPNAPQALDWWLWLALGLALLGLGHGLALLLPRLACPPSRLAGRLAAAAAGLCALLLLVAIFFTQSRGPWIGLGAGLFAFCSLLIWQGLRRARAAQNLALARRLRAALLSWVGLTLATGGFLIAFNLSDAPLFQRLRELPYIGRMGQLLELDSGTGLVRRLIWVGDEHAGGAVGLVSSDPLRALIGYGPESMFVAFNPFFPPSLANVEARGASPDRSHQALLDELVTKGAIGLASYLFLLLSFFALCWRLIAAEADWRRQTLLIAILSSVICCVVEGLTGIPIVSTLMTFWLLLGLTVALGAMSGHYRLGAPGPAAPAAPAPGQRRKGQPRASARPPRAAGPARGRVQPGLLASYGLIAAMGLGLAGLNLTPIYADMRFQQGQSEAQIYPGIDGLVRSLEEYLATVRSNPREDFYYLNIGRTLMVTADTLRAMGYEPGTPRSAADLRELTGLRGEDAVVGFLQREPPMALMSYAEAALLRAYSISPLNKDHSANLGRLNSAWYAMTADQARLDEALDWYEQATRLAPLDVTLINERAGVIGMLGQASGAEPAAADYYARARALLLESARLDPRYTDTQLRLAELTIEQGGSLDEAAEHYLAAVAIDPRAAVELMTRAAERLAERPDLIGRLGAAYAAAATDAEGRLAALPPDAPELPALRDEAALLHSAAGLLVVRSSGGEQALSHYRRAVELAPDSPQYSRNYTIVLSDTRRYDAAIAEADRLLGLLQAGPYGEQELAQARQLVEIVRRQAGQP